MSPPLPDLFREVKGCGFDAVATRIGPTTDAAWLAQVAVDAGVTLVPGTTGFTLPESADDEAVVLATVRGVARVYAELGMRHVFLPAAMDPDAGRVAHPAQGFDASDGRLARLIELIARVGEVATAEGMLPGLLDDYQDRIHGLHVKDLRTDVAEHGRAQDLGYRQTVVNGLWVEPGRGDLEYDPI